MTESRVLTACASSKSARELAELLSKNGIACSINTKEVSEIVEFGGSLETVYEVIVAEGDFEPALHVYRRLVNDRKGS